MVYKIIICAVFLLFPSVSYGQQPVKQKGWVDKQLLEIQIFPFKDRAYRFLQQGKPQQAAAEFAKALNLDNSDTVLRMDYAQALFSSQKYEEAAQQAAKIITINPDDDHAVLLRSEALQKCGNHSEAVKTLASALEKGRFDPGVRKKITTSLVNLLLNQHDYAKAYKLLKEEPTSFSSGKKNYIQAVVYKNSGRPAEAKAAYKSALLDKIEAQDRIISLSDLADLEMDEGNFQEARTYLLEAYKLNSYLSSISSRMADLEYKTGHYDQALKWADRSLQLEDNKNVYLLKAFILSKLNQPGSALNIFDELITKSDSNIEKAQLYVHKGNISNSYGQLKTAEESFRNALALKSDVATMRSLAMVYSAQGKWDETVETYKLILQSYDSPEDRVQLAVALMECGKDKQAIEALREAVNSGKLSSDDEHYALSQLGFLEYNSGEFLSAEQTFQKIAEKFSFNQKNQLALGRTQLKLGKYDLALSSFLKVNGASKNYETMMLIAEAYEKSGQQNKALEEYYSVINTNYVKGDALASVLERAGMLESLGDNFSKAGILYEKAYALAKNKDTELLLRAGEAYFSANELSKTIQALKAYFSKPDSKYCFEAYRLVGASFLEQDLFDEAGENYMDALNDSRLSDKQRYRILVNIGYIKLRQGRNSEGIEFLRKAMKFSDENFKVRLDIAEALYKLGKYTEALAEFKKAESSEMPEQVYTGISFCYDKLNKPGLALHYMTLAEKCSANNSELQRLALFDQLAYLCMSEESYRKAVEYYEKSLAIKQSSLRSYGLGRSQRLLQDMPSARQAFASVSPEELSISNRAQFYEEMGRINSYEKDYAQAINYFSKAGNEKPSSERLYLQGQAEGKVGNLDKAIDCYQRALKENPYDVYAVSLGYAYYNKGDFEKTVPLFEDVYSRDNDYIKLPEDLAYITKKLYRNEDSIDWFKVAIDNKPFYFDETPASLRKKIYGFKDELRSLTNRFDLTAFYSYSENGVAATTDSQDVRAGILDNSAGVELGYTPEEFGFRNGKIFQFIGRVTIGKTKDNAFSFDTDSLQGAFGVRYKPFSQINAAVGVERLIKLGNKAEDNTLLRVMASWDDGWAMKPAESSWNYSFVFGEADYYLEGYQRAVFILHGRQGWTWNIDDQWLITPHAYATYKYITPDRDKTSYFEAGPGLSIRFLEGESKYISYEREWEFLLRYSFGSYLEGTKSSFNGLSGSLRFSF
ncbi:exported protein of unknown function [Maridesulfovibrio hydrothermalis AM13 = DSM 14728]|uniref:Bacteriophage N4 adsorption protein A C-terminal domain-containing protein n=1 Tax=Maridesulfovibrio hydrothermalis AM13 = DSM 14728 TaxID=1121451 RepID=L0RE40_9BACT|nr:exported protein of unknown function [Maridesulfovibrio hydrothermalis AM13 = DSM 14728]